ncbi:hypothetical protein ACFLU5_07680 [Bacteroidota bacterium]
MDSLTIVPGSIILSDTVSFTYEYNQETEMLTISTLKKDPPDSVNVRYTVFPYDFRQSFARRDISEIDSTVTYKNTLIHITDPLNKREELFETDNLYKSGALSRGISFGNRQNIFVNSVLNLQMDGNLTDDLKIKASITDQNVPYQPEGNTRLVQDFDNVFVRLYNEKISITAGDLVLRNPDSYFLQYYKNVKGVSVESSYNTFGNATASTHAAYSVAKGKFASFQIPVMEGISGPYKIRGPENQRHVIIIANSETVFLDGRQLVRGYAYDYTIDYNTGEITFTPNILITKFSRVRIDFEYSQQNYSRSILSIDQTLKSGPASLSVGYYQEKDNPNQPIFLDLSDEEKQYLGTIGDDMSRAYVPGFDSVGWTQDQILYKLIDTTDFAGNPVQIFQYSTNSDSALYQVIFTESGLGNGHYILKTSLGNGRVFEWIMNKDGVSQGNYMPVRQVALPSKKSLFNIRGGLDITQNETVSMEVAFSGTDKNLYSPEEDIDNSGMAYKVGFSSDKREIGKKNSWIFSGRTDFEFTDERFSPIDRFRYIEFDRDWSFDPNEELNPSQDNILNISAALKKDAINHICFSASRRLRGTSVNGWQENGGIGLSIGKLILISDFFHLDNQSLDYHSNWHRFNFQTYYNTKFLVPGYQFSVDRNEIRQNSSDSLISTAMNYDEHKVFLRSNDSLKSSWKIDFGIRKDRIPAGGEMRDHSLSKTISLNYSTAQSKLGQLKAVLTYRDLEFLDLPDSIASEETLLGRFDWFAGFLDNHIRSELTYAIGNGRELKREYIYIEIPIGQGTHTWRDNNDDGLQDLDEFYLAVNPDERNYIKIFVPTDEYILAYDNQINYRLSLSMPRSWRAYGGFRGFISKFSNQLAISYQNKILNDRLVSRFLPVYDDLPVDDILSRREKIRNTIFFNRSNPSYGMDLNFLKSENRQLLVNGFESRSIDETNLNLRANIEKQYNLKISARSGISQSVSDYLADRNYLVRTMELKPELAWQPSDFWRITGNYSYSHKSNDSQENHGEFSIHNEFGIQFKYSRAIQRMMTLGARYIKIDFDGEENSALGYELLNALKPGDNLTWTFIIQQKLLNGLQLNAIYEGRNSGDIRVIHTGRMQVTALF